MSGIVWDVQHRDGVVVLRVGPDVSGSVLTSVYQSVPEMLSMLDRIRAEVLAVTATP